MKKILLIASLSLFVFGMVSCGENTNTTKGAESKELVVLYDQAINAGVGNADDVIDNLKDSIDSASSVMQTAYNHTVILNDAMHDLGFDLVYDDWGWAESLMQKQTLAFLAEDGADIMIGETQMPGFAKQGLLKPFPESLANYIRENLLPAAYKPMEIDGQIYGVATQPSVSLLVYNQAIIDEVFGDEYTPPLTWEDWLSDMEAVAAKSYIPGGVYAGPNAGGYLRFGVMQFQAGGGFVNSANEPAINTPENKIALQFLRDMADLNPRGMLTSSSASSMTDQFLNGNMAYFVDGSYNPTTCHVYPALGEGGCTVAPLPLPSQDAEDSFITIGASFLSVPEYIDDDKVEAAFKYIETAISEDAQTPILASGIRIPVNKNVFTDDYLENNPILEQYYQAMLSENINGLPTFTYENSKCWQQVGYMYIKAATTDMTIDEILSDAQSAIVEYYNRNQ
jgi:multiple sugar transport system substrate-binding protein